jgi:eukaryotic-like serine/threonine-protein kinase
MEPSPEPGRRTSLVAASADEEERAFLQERLAVLGAVAGLLTVVFYFVVHLLRGGGDGPFLQSWLSNPQDLGILGVALVYGVMWGVARGPRRSLRTLRLVEGALTVLACGWAALHSWVGPDAALFRMDALIGANNMLVVRAILLPSSVRRTIGVGAIAYLPVVVPAAVRLAAPPVGVALLQLQLDLALFAGWAVVAVAVSAVVSGVVYGLRRRIRAARKLGRYQLERLLGAGHMGEVHLARHALLRRPCAIKLLRPERTGEDAIARFEQEVQLTSQLTHPNTVSIFDYGRTPDRVFYYVMEYLDGLDLDRLVDQDGPQPPGRVIHILRQVCASLVEAHEAGLVHRDVKAANVILCRRGGVHDVVKVVDFGLAQTRIAPDEAGTDDPRVVGTPAYLSPEGFASPDGVDARSDLYALGVTGYLLLTGELPFEGASLAALCGQHMIRTPDPLAERLGRSVPADLEAVVLGCLAKEPDDRPGSARILDAALAACSDSDRWSPADAAAWWAGRDETIDPEAEAEAIPLAVDVRSR